MNQKKVSRSAVAFYFVLKLSFQAALLHIQGYFKGTETQLKKYWSIRLERPSFQPPDKRELAKFASEHINSLPLTKLLAKMSAGAPGAESENQLFKSKTTFLPNLI